MTITEKILAEHARRTTVKPGENIWIDVDLLMTHDVCGPGTIGIFKKEFGQRAKVWNPQKVVIIPDHYIFTKDKHAKRNIDILREFAKEQSLPYFYDVGTSRYKGVCHVTLAEEGFTVPGSVLFGTDSHTCTAGAFGLFATGIGNTDAAFIMGTGRLWVKVPETMLFILEGSLPPYVMAKDFILRIIGDIGVDGATYRAMEFDGEGIASLNMEERMTLCNMVIEAGGKNGIIAPDDKTFSFLKARSDQPVELLKTDYNSQFIRTHIYRSKDLEPVVAQPYSPASIEAARQLGEVSLDQCYIGSCTGGKITDFIAAAKILKGKSVQVKTVIVPATTSVDKQLTEEKIDGRSLRDIFIDAGGEIGPPSCAACLGGPEDTFGRLNGREVCISTTNRNFPGRMGSRESKTYLASPLTVAASAITGKITDPREVMG
ncbi:3-isopropylmalate dehydratase large subunit [bacterium]|nr:3-isopropylmalate dehydratase large subunit [bacterium]RQV95293.1 MAG: 3-isopropylmalate dehydratase large subunit [bacterium]